MKTCKVIFRDETLNQDIIISCELSDNDELTFKTTFDPPANEKTNLGSLSGQLAYEFLRLLKGTSN